MVHTAQEKRRTEGPREGGRCFFYDTTQSPLKPTDEVYVTCVILVSLASTELLKGGYMEVIVVESDWIGYYPGSVGVISFGFGSSPSYSSIGSLTDPPNELDGSIK